MGKETRVDVDSIPLEVWKEFSLEACAKVDKMYKQIMELCDLLIQHSLPDYMAEAALCRAAECWSSVKAKRRYRHDKAIVDHAYVELNLDCLDEIYGQLVVMQHKMVPENDWVVKIPPLNIKLGGR